MKIDEVIQQPGTKERMLKESVMQDLHVAFPGIVVSFNSDDSTIVVQPSVRKRGSTEAPPLIMDVPVFFPGPFTYPISQGDECLVVIADQCIDAWFQNGGITNPLSARRHDLSDAFAFVGFRSKVATGARVDLADLVHRIEVLEGGS